jgi:hypothetical protein
MGMAIDLIADEDVTMPSSGLVSSPPRKRGNVTFRDLGEADPGDRFPFVPWPAYPDDGMAEMVVYCPGTTLADWYRDCGGDYRNLSTGDGCNPGDAFWPTRPDTNCPDCGWKFESTGHLKGAPCPDLLTYKYLIEREGWTVRQLAAFYDRSYSWIYGRVAKSGAELGPRGRRPKGDDTSPDQAIVTFPAAIK